jgi:hypothetical protein
MIKRKMIEVYSQIIPDSVSPIQFSKIIETQIVSDSVTPKPSGDIIETQIISYHLYN